MTTNEMLDIERAIELLDLMLADGGDRGERLVVPFEDVKKTGKDDGLSGRQYEIKRQVVRDGRAARDSLISARSLLAVAHQLLTALSDRSVSNPQDDRGLLTEEIRIAARRAYRAGLILSGFDVGAEY